MARIVQDPAIDGILHKPRQQERFVFRRNPEKINGLGGKLLDHAFHRATGTGLA